MGLAGSKAEFVPPFFSSVFLPLLPLSLAFFLCSCALPHQSPHHQTAWMCGAVGLSSGGPPVIQRFGGYRVDAPFASLKRFSRAGELSFFIFPLSLRPSPLVCRAFLFFLRGSSTRSTQYRWLYLYMVKIIVVENPTQNRRNSANCLEFSS
jgi:hypothetical protein